MEDGSTTSAELTRSVQLKEQMEHSHSNRMISDDLVAAR